MGPEHSLRGGTCWEGSCSDLVTTLHQGADPGSGSPPCTRHLEVCVWPSGLEALNRQGGDTGPWLSPVRWGVNSIVTRFLAGSSGL